MKGDAVIRLHFSSKKKLEATLEALKPETRSMLSRRCQVKICTKGKNMTLILEAEDTSSLRAAVNSYLRWILLTKTVVESISLAESKVSG